MQFNPKRNPLRSLTSLQHLRDLSVTYITGLFYPHQQEHQLNLVELKIIDKGPRPPTCTLGAFVQQ